MEDRAERIVFLKQAGIIQVNGESGQKPRRDADTEAVIMHVVFAHVYMRRLGENGK